jgi:putative IMPACT (imprinted ancient) family translation regulator
MMDERASDEVTDAIAHIEMHRQEMEKEAGLATACNESLRKLNELLKEEQELLQRHGSGTLHALNVEVVTNEIRKVKNMMGGSGHAPASRKPQSEQRRQPQRSGPRTPDKKKGRRTMGRRGEG